MSYGCVYVSRMWTGVRYPRPVRGDRELRKLIADAVRGYRRECRARLREARMAYTPMVVPRG